MYDTSNMYPHCRVLYKMEDTPGWYVAYIDGDIEAVTKKCEKLWKNFKVFQGGLSVERIKDEIPADVRAEDAHLYSGWTYSSELGKWFLPDELIPMPKSKCIVAQKFSIECDFDADMDDSIEEKKESLFEESCFDFHAVDVVADCNFITDSGEYAFTFQYFKSMYKDSIKNLFKALDENRYYCFFVEEYWYTQILIWSDDTICRIIVQDYNSNESRGVIDKLDFIIDKQTAIATFRKWFDDLDNRLNYYETGIAAILTNEEKDRIKSDECFEFGVKL